MGKFDKRAVGEKEGERTPAGKRRKLAPVVDNAGVEQTSQVRIVHRIAALLSEAGRLRSVVVRRLSIGVAGHLIHVDDWRRRHLWTRSCESAATMS